MIEPKLTASERAAVRAAGSMTRVEYPNGAVIAQCGHLKLFAAGGAESFNALWREAQALRAEVEK
jgi:hypothetical protein